MSCEVVHKIAKYWIDELLTEQTDRVKQNIFLWVWFAVKLSDRSFSFCLEICSAAECTSLQLPCSNTLPSSSPFPPSLLLPPPSHLAPPLENPDMIHAAVGALTKEIVQWQKPALIINDIFSRKLQNMFLLVNVKRRFQILKYFISASIWMFEVC